MTVPSQYVPGPAVAVVNGPTAVLLDVPPEDPMVARVAALLADGGGVDDILDALVTSGLRSLVDFGAFQIGPNGVRMVVRGRVSGSVGELAGLSAEHTMWHDTWQPDATDASLEVAGAASAPVLPIGLGVVLAGAIASAAASVGRRVANSTVADQAEIEPPASPRKLVEPAAEDAIAQPSEPAQPTAPDETAAEKAVPDQAEEAAVSASLPKAEEAATEGPTPQPDEPAGPIDAEAPSGADFAHLFGATQQAPQPGTENRQEDAGLEPTGAAPGDSGATMAAPLTLPAADLPVEPKPVPPAGPGLITAVPWVVDSTPEPQELVAPGALAANPAQGLMPGWSSAAPVAADAPLAAFKEVADPADQVDRTVNRSALVGLPQVMVVAARCAEGHLSPAYAGSCRVCAGSIPQQQPVEIPRPTLGQLRLSTGGVVPLDRPVILGRNPRIPPGYAAEQPNLVRLSDPNKDVSGQHLEVCLDYWNVVVRDLGSTNGTEVILPGEMPVALRTNDPMLIVPGSRVLLGGAVSFTFEVLP